MTNLLDFALSKVRDLTPDRQDQAARAMLDVVAGVEEDTYVLSEAEKIAIEKGREQIRRGEYANEREVRELLAKYR